MLELTPRKIVAELDKYIIGQKDAKRAVAIAIRNRWRRQMVESEMKKEIGPKNMLMIGPTGVGKTEIARRLATLTGAPFVKVEATKYTEVGYYGRDVESMVRDLLENAIGLVRKEERKVVAEQARAAVEDRLVALLADSVQRKSKKEGAAAPSPLAEEPLSGKVSDDPSSNTDFMRMVTDLSEAMGSVKYDPSNPAAGIRDILKTFENNRMQKEKEQGDDSSSTSTVPPELPAAEELLIDQSEIRQRLLAGEYENEIVSLLSEQKMPPVIMGGIGMESMENDLQSMLENILPKRSSKREVTVSEARRILLEQETERLLDKEKINAKAIDLAENLGIIFIDEIDKIVASEQQHGADVSRQGVQRDMLPIVEGTTIQTKYGFISTEHILFIAAGAFHRAKPTDLMPELQGRFPIRVELTDLSKEDFIQILTEPQGSLTKQYSALMKTEGVDLSFTEDAIEALADYAHEVNQRTQNIGARRLYTIMERLLEELSFEAPDMKMGSVVVNAAYVKERIGQIVVDEDLNRFIL